MRAFAEDVTEAAKIALFCTLAAVTYGILHDQVTAHLCVEYFTIAHPPVFPTTSPFWLAIGWGIIATWWVGLPLGLALALAARVGGGQKLSLRQVRPYVFFVFATAAVCAVLAGIVGAYVVATGRAPLLGGWAAVIPPARQVAFSADAWAHLASYGVGAAGGVIAIVATVWRRVRGV